MGYESRECGVVIAGLGDVHLRDDGVGVHAVYALQRHPMPGVAALNVGTRILDMVDSMCRERHVIAIDAVRGGSAPGTLYQFDPWEMGPAAGVVSGHALGLVEALLMLRQPDDGLPIVTVLGVEPEVVAYGKDLSLTLRRVLPRIVETVRCLAEIAAEHEGPLPKDTVPGVRRPLRQNLGLLVRADAALSTMDLTMAEMGRNGLWPGWRGTIGHDRYEQE
jgi:hydrogenase maturation protease